MGLFDRFKKNKITIEQLMDNEYEPKYLQECKFIWKNYVPESGQSDVLQGELLRELEKLRVEAQDNGNINWDDDFSCFCDFISETLCSQSIFSALDKEKITLVLKHLKACGNYARQFQDGAIPADELNVDMIAYTEDNLYDIVADAIGFFHVKTGEPLPYQHNGRIRR